MPGLVAVCPINLIHSNAKGEAAQYTLPMIASVPNALHNIGFYQKVLFDYRKKQPTDYYKVNDLGGPQSRSSQKGNDKI